MTTRVGIGIIGGSGVYQMEGLAAVEEVRIKTPFGDPSDAITLGTLAGVRLAFLPRHGRGHRIMPTEVNSRANIFALKTLGVERIVSISACGSLREDYAPRHIVIPDQIFDHTRGHRAYTFFGNGMVAHISFAEPFCPDLSALVYEAVRKTGATVHQGGAFITIEGPRFSTKAESRAYRQWGMDIIGMTAVPEAQLAREAEICYAAMAHVTDYDVWHETEAPVTVEMLIGNLVANAAVTKEAIANLAPTAHGRRTCECATALSSAIITQLDMIPEQVKIDLAPLVGKYVH
jgi:5'-methylthioadenosine phosphorylase